MCRAAHRCGLCHKAICKVHSEAFSLHIGVVDALLFHQAGGRRSGVSAERNVYIYAARVPAGENQDRSICHAMCNVHGNPHRYATVCS